MNAYIKGIFFTLVVLATYIADGKTITIALVDTGYSYSNVHNEVNICGKYNATNDTKDITESVYHGSLMVDIIAQYLNKHKVDYCIYVIKYMDKEINVESYIKALRYLEKVDADVINLSLSGIVKLDYECDILSKLLDKGVIMTAAMGNEGIDVSQIKTYPAMCDDRIYKAQSTSSKTNYNSKPIPNVIKLDTPSTSVSSALWSAMQAEKLFKESK